MSSFGKEFLKTAIRRLKYYKDLGDKTFAQLQDWDLHYQPNADANSIAIIIQHISGNMQSRWTNFLTEDGEKEWRQRDAEFENYDYSKKELLELWENGWNCCFETLEKLTKKDLKATITIRQEPISVIDAINRQMAHYPYHVGQIIHIAKSIKGKNWNNLSIPRAASLEFNESEAMKDPSQKF